jgi:GTPase
MDENLIKAPHPDFKAGYVNILGKPNVGKSTLMNALLGERMSIITHKPQTTRHRILGIYHDDDAQIVFSDSPGIIDKPSYKMQEVMNKSAYEALEDGDVILFMVAFEEEHTGHSPVFEAISKTKAPVFLIVNKIDLATQEGLTAYLSRMTDLFPFAGVYPISALHNAGVEGLLRDIKSHLPKSPPFFPPDQLSDRSERFFAAEIIREEILLQYSQEIPYSCEVAILLFKEEEARKGPILHISAEIFVARKTQKSILIGKGGLAIKSLGQAARKKLEAFFDKRIFLELHVKVKENWRDDERFLKHFGYE